MVLKIRAIGVFIKSKIYNPLQLRKSLIDIKDILIIEDDVFYDFFELPKSQRSDFTSSQKDLDSFQVVKFCHNFDINYNHLVSGDINLFDLKFLKNPEFLPEKYCSTPFSKRRTSLNSLIFFEKKFGSEKIIRILRDMNLTLGHFKDPDMPINILFPNDLYSKLKEIGLTGLDFYHMGLLSSKVNKSSPFAKELLECTNQKDLFERFINTVLLKYFDQNFHYRIHKLNDFQCVLRAYQNEEVLEGLKLKTLCTLETDLVKAGGFASTPHYIDQPICDVKLTKCLAKGDAFSEFTINFSEFESFL